MEKEHTKQPLSNCDFTLKITVRILEEHFVIRICKSSVLKRITIKSINPTPFRAC